MRNEGGVVLVRDSRQPDVLDVRLLVASAMDGFCEQFAISGRENRRDLLKRISAEAREMAAEL